MEAFVPKIVRDTCDKLTMKMVQIRRGAEIRAGGGDSTLRTAKWQLKQNKISENVMILTLQHMTNGLFSVY